MSVIKDADLVEAEKELRRAYSDIVAALVAVEEDSAQYRWSRSPEFGKEMPIVHIMPRGPRVEAGWYKPHAWEKSSGRTAKRLGAETARQFYDEVFIAGEALGWPRRQLVDLLLHQAVHQASRTASTTYHSKRFKGALYSLGLREDERHPTYGWNTFTVRDEKLERDLTKIADGLKSNAFDVYRLPKSGSVRGKMRKWQCTCWRGAKVYTGAVLRADCRDCGKPFVYVNPDAVGNTVQAWCTRNRIILRGAEVAPWKCDACQAEVPGGESHPTH